MLAWSARDSRWPVSSVCRTGTVRSSSTSTTSRPYKGNDLDKVRSRSHTGIRLEPTVSRHGSPTECRGGEGGEALGVRRRHGGAELGRPGGGGGAPGSWTPRTAKRRLARLAAETGRRGALAHVRRGRRGGARVRVDRLEVEPARRRSARSSGCRPASRRSGWSGAQQGSDRQAQAQGKDGCPGRAVVAAAKRSGTWTALDAVEALEMPADLRRALAADARAKRHVEAFPPRRGRASSRGSPAAKRDVTRERRGRGDRPPGRPERTRQRVAPAVALAVRRGPSATSAVRGVRGGAPPSAGRRRLSRRSRSRARRRARWGPAGG